MTFRRDDLIDNLVEVMADSMDMESLIQYYVDGTIDFLNGLSDEELIDQADWFEMDVSEYGYQVDMFEEAGNFNDAEAYASAGWGTDEDYGSASDLV